MLKIKSKLLSNVIYSTLVILTYVLLSRTLKLYFIEHIPVVTSVYAWLSRVCTVVVAVLFILSFKKIPKLQFFSLCAVYVFMLLSTLVNNGNLWRFISNAYPVIGMCAFVILMCSTIESTKRFVKIMSAFFAIIMSLNLLLFIFTPNLFGMTASNGRIFFVGLENQIIYSQTVGLLFTKLDDRLNGNKFIFQFYTAIYVITTIINFSVGSVIGAFVLLLYMFFPAVKNFFGRGNYGLQIGLFFAILVSVVFFATPILNFPPIKFLIEEVLGKSTTLTHRTEIWSVALEGILKKPFLGYGMADTDNLFQIFVDGVPKVWSAHNQYLQFAYEYGLITFAVFCGFMLITANILKKCVDDRLTGLILAFSFALMIMYLVEAPSFDALYFVLILGASVCSAVKHGEFKKTEEFPDKITVVVPVYNIEEFLPECLDSVINQSYENLEIIIVNDGSTDGSLKICEDYAKRDERIKLITQENGGLSAARNTAIAVASGKYITFVDSDDYIHPDMINVLYTQLKLNNSDMSVCQFMPVNEKSELLNVDRYYPALNIEGNKNCMRELLLDTGIKTCAWGKLHLTSVFKDFNYPEGKYHEDVYTTYRIVDLCDKITICPEQLYFYRQRSNSIMHHSFSPKHLDVVEGNVLRAEYINQRYTNLKIETLSGVVYAANSCAKRLIGVENIDEETVKYLQQQYRKYESYFLLGHSKIIAKIFSVAAFVNLKLLLKCANLLFEKVRK